MVVTRAQRAAQVMVVVPTAPARRSSPKANVVLVPVRTPAAKMTRAQALALLPASLTSSAASLGKKKRVRRRPTSQLKPCNDGWYRGPARRCRKVTKAPRKKQVRRTRLTKNCKPGKARSVLSHRCVTVGGPAYNRQFQFGMEL